MIKLTDINVFNMAGAFNGLRNPMNSWDNSDSIGDVEEWDIKQEDVEEIANRYAELLPVKNDELVQNERYKYSDLLHANCDLSWGSNGDITNYFLLGPNDLALAQRMIAAGTDESKFLRQIFVTIDIEAPLYWWKEMDTYKVGTVANSCSTMHKLATTPITRECFSFDMENDDLPVDYIDQSSVTPEGIDCGFVDHWHVEDGIDSIIQYCEELRLAYLETKDKRYWRALIQLLPESWNQKRTWTANYQVLRAIYFARRNHKLSEWHEFCDMIEKLPYGTQLITYKKEDK